MVKSSRLTQAQYARRIGRSPSRISQLVKCGIIQLTKGRIDPVQADAAIEANIDRSREVRSELMRIRNANHHRQLNLLDPPNDDEPVVSLAETRRQHEAVKMELSRLRLEVERGNLVPRNQLLEWGTLIVANARIRLLGMPRRTAEIFAAMQDPCEIEELHRREIREVLTEMAQGFGLDEGHANIAKGGERAHEQIDSGLKDGAGQFQDRDSPWSPDLRTSGPSCSVSRQQIDDPNRENPRSGDRGDFQAC